MGHTTMRKQPQHTNTSHKYQGWHSSHNLVANRIQQFVATSPPSRDPQDVARHKHRAIGCCTTAATCRWSASSRRSRKRTVGFPQRTLLAPCTDRSTYENQCLRWRPHLQAVSPSATLYTHALVAGHPHTSSGAPSPLPRRATHLLQPKSPNAPGPASYTCRLLARM